MRGRWTTGWAALLAATALLLGGCARQPAAPAGADARPALWRATSGTTTYWLFGTIHLTPPSLGWRTPAIERAIAASDTLITEIPEESAQAQAAIFLRLAQARDLPPIRDRVPPAARDALVAAAAQARMPLAALDRMATWAAALTLTSASAKAVGATRAAAPEAVLGRAFAGKRHAALETFTGQLGIFAALPEADQRQLLLAAIRSTRDAETEFRTLLNAWAAGDPAAIQAAFNRAFADAPALTHALVTDRNRAWADELARRDPGTALVAVGAGHMIGADGLPALLGARGFRVARMQ